MQRLLKKFVPVVQDDEAVTASSRLPADLAGGSATTGPHVRHA